MCLLNNRCAYRLAKFIELTKSSNINLKLSDSNQVWRSCDDVKSNKPSQKVIIELEW